MDLPSNWIPGCYRNLPIAAGESLPGYLLRLAEANGYAGIQPLLRATGLWTSKNGYSFKLRARPDLLAAIGRMAVGDPHHLDSHGAKELKGQTYLFHSLLVDGDALLPERTQVCPQCLVEDGFVKEELELGPVTACSRHHSRLIDACPACGYPLRWTRTSLMHCGKCGTDLRLLPGEPVDPEICEVAEDFAALAPFRAAGHNGEVLTVEWDIMFRIFKALALPGSAVAAGKWPKKLVQLLPVHERHAIAEQLARVRRNGTYFLAGLRWNALPALAPLTAVPRPHVPERCAMHVLTEAWLPDELAEAICSPERPLPPELSGAEVFHGRPPTLRTQEEVLAFLATDMGTFDGLLAREILTLPTDEDLGYDIDDVLAAQTFLYKGLLTLPELSSIVGVPLDWDDLTHSTLIRPWNPRNSADMRVAVDDLLVIQKRLTENWTPGFDAGQGVRLGDLAGRAARPFQVVSDVVVRACRGELSAFGWARPFDWASIVLCEHDAEEWRSPRSSTLRPSKAGSLLPVT